MTISVDTLCWFAPLSPYSTGKRVCIGYPAPADRKQTTNNMKSTWPTRSQREIAQRELYSTGVGAHIRHYRLALGIINLRWALFACVGSSRWVRRVFWIPTCWYRHRECLALGVLPNARPQREWFRIAVEYRLNLFL